MEDSIINIEECDSFSLSSDTDIKNIVDQWKHNDSKHSTDYKDLKYVDTRTFTRPKKKSFSSAEVNGRDGASNEYSSLDNQITLSATSAAVPVPKIDLKIGGLVTSMQRSFLGDVSPPSNILTDSSIDPIGESLITSSDFTNVNEFITGSEDSLSMAQFNQYRLTDAINDRNFLERLTNYDDSLFTKDADINNIDGTHLIDNGNGTFSGNSTLQNSTDSSSNLGKNDETFVAAEAEKFNATFDTSAKVDRTFVQAPVTSNGSNNNHTFNFNDEKNLTFKKPASIHEKLLFENINDEIALDDEELSLYGTFDLGSNIDMKKSDNIANTTMNLSNKSHTDLNKSESTTPKSVLKGLESTPARINVVRKSRRSETLANISPILAEELKEHTKPQLTNVDKFVDVEIDDFPVFLRTSLQKSSSRISNPTVVDKELREKERQSLSNFEDFENTLLILENNKNEEEFDDLLNSFSSNVRNPLSDKVRQSLDNIKKRHSLVNVEKQQQDELNREKSISKHRNYGDLGLTNERNRLNESFNRSPMVSSTSSTGSGNGERLLRRSRLFDDVMNSCGSPNHIEQMSSSGSSSSPNDNSQTIEHNTTELLNRKNRSHLTREIEKTENNETAYNNDNNSSGDNSKSNNRDRFKTIRIFKRPPENAIQIPDVDHSGDETYRENVSSAPIVMQRTYDAFAMKNVNSPKKTAANETYDNDPTMESAKAINTMTFKKSALARPRQLSGLSKRDSYAKSNSHEILSNDDEAPYLTPVPKTVPQLKSPMGIKSKSVHNLTSTSSLSTYKAPHNLNEQFGRQASGFSRPSMSSNLFKVPTAKPLATMRQRTDVGQPRKLSLIRPSSGYYSYNVKRTDSDSESGRFSSNNSLSSASSKGSLNRGETPEYASTSNGNLNSTFVQSTCTSSTANGVSGSAQPRLSMLRPPTQIRKSGLPRPTATKR